LVDGVRKIEAAMGSVKRVNDLEKPIREWAFRSIVTTRAVAIGETIDGDMIWSKRPGTGIPSHLRDRIIGRRAVRPIGANVLLSWADIDGEAAL
jgi:N-acetylneuraminate synthase